LLFCEEKTRSWCKIATSLGVSHRTAVQSLWAVATRSW
jgi:hypothetical protein